jgi:hypothetical protein
MVRGIRAKSFPPRPLEAFRDRARGHIPGLMEAPREGGVLWPSDIPCGIQAAGTAATTLPYGATEPPLSRRRGREMAVRAERITWTERRRRRQVGETTASLFECTEA